MTVAPEPSIPSGANKVLQKLRQWREAGYKPKFPWETEDQYQRRVSGTGGARTSGGQDQPERGHSNEGELPPSRKS